MGVLLTDTWAEAPLRQALLGHESGTAFAGHAGAQSAWISAAPQDEPRLRFAAAVFGLAVNQVQTGTDRHWSIEVLAGTQSQVSDETVQLVRDVMDLHGLRSAREVADRLGQMRVMAASRVRARREASPPQLQPSRRALRQPYAAFFAVEEYDLDVPRLTGGAALAVTRAAFVSGDAVTVLPYDPRRDRVLVIEQFRAGPYGRGDPDCYLFEAIAGRIDAGETPEQAGRREAVEEAGLTLGAFWPVAAYYPTPGAMTEYLYSYVAVCDLPDGSAGVFGLAEESEDIRGHLLDFAAFMAMVSDGRIRNAPLILTALWLQRERDRLRAAAPA